jgi:hypothetical protein
VRSLRTDDICSGAERFAKRNQRGYRESGEESSSHGVSDTDPDPDPDPDPGDGDGEGVAQEGDDEAFVIYSNSIWRDYYTLHIFSNSDRYDTTRGHS